MNMPEAETKTCQHRTLKGGRGVNDASGVREWGCALEEGHDAPCDYSRDLGEPSTVTGGGDVRERQRRMDILAVRDALRTLDEVTSTSALESMPLERLHAIEKQTKVLNDVVDAFGPRREVVAMIEDVTREVQKWA